MLTSPALIAAFGELEQRAIRLSAFERDDPHPGLFTWQMARSNLAKQVLEAREDVVALARDQGTLAIPTLHLLTYGEGLTPHDSIFLLGVFTSRDAAKKHATSVVDGWADVKATHTVTFERDEREAVIEVGYENVNGSHYHQKFLTVALTVDEPFVIE